MAYYNYSDVRVSIADMVWGDPLRAGYSQQVLFNNFTHLYATKVDLSTQADINSKYVVEERSSFSRAPQGGIKGSLSVSYFLTGSDPLKKYMEDETQRMTSRVLSSPITTPDYLTDRNYNILAASVGGMIFYSGYLVSHSFDAQPFAPVIINANIDFYGTLSGNYNPSAKGFPSQSVQMPSAKPLTFTDVEVNGSGLDTEKIQSISYRFSSQIQPTYHAGNITPSDVRYLRKDIIADVQSYEISGALDYKGDDASIKINLSNDTGVAEKYSVVGPIDNKKIGVAHGERLASSFSFKQNFLGDPPTLGALSTSGNAMLVNGTQGEVQWFHIDGTNLRNTTTIEVGDRRVKSFGVLSDEKLSGVIAEDTMPGVHYISASTYGGRAITPTNVLTVGDAAL